MGKMKEIAQIHIYRYPHIYLEDIFKKKGKEYNTFIKLFDYTPEDIIFNRTIKWKVAEKYSNELFNKVNDTLLLLDFKPNDIVYLEL